MNKSNFYFRRIRISLATLLLTFLYAVTALGAVSITSDRASVPLNEAFRVRVEFSDEPMENYTVEGLENFNVMGRSTSKSISIINFKKMSQETEDYLLRPKKAGNFQLQVKTKSGISNAVAIEVTKGSSSSVNTPAGIPNSAPKNMASQKNGAGTAQVQNSNYAMIAGFGESRNKKFYFGEKFIFSETFLAFRSPRDFRITRSAEFPDFTEKNLTPTGRGGTIQQSIIDYNGRQALEMPLYLGILQANSSGKKKIEGYEVQILDSSYQYYGGEPYEIEILPLPDGKPSNFKDIVGKLQLSSKFGKTEGSIGQPLILNLKLFGEVNLDNLEKIEIMNSEDFTVYETLKNSMEDIVNGKYYAEKNFEVAFIPKRAGTLKTPEIKISFLNSSTGKYEEKTVASQTLEISGAVSASPGTVEENSLKPETGSLSEKNSDAGKISEEKDNNVTVDFLVEDSSRKGLEKRDYIIGALILLNILLLGAIIYILKKDSFSSKFSKGKIDHFREMRKAKNDIAFYEAYCQYMKERYRFNPRIHSETRLPNSDLVEVNRIMEDFRYRGIPFSKNEIISNLKSLD